MKVTESFDTAVVDMRFVKPFGEALVHELASSYELLVTIEENVMMGSTGSAVGELLASEGLEVPLLQPGPPGCYVEHVKPSEMLAECSPDAVSIEKTVYQHLDRWQCQTQRQRRTTALRLLALSPNCPQDE